MMYLSGFRQETRFTKQVLMRSMRRLFTMAWAGMKGHTRPQYRHPGLSTTAGKMLSPLGLKAQGGEIVLLELRAGAQVAQTPRWAGAGGLPASRGGNKCYERGTRVRREDAYPSFFPLISRPAGRSSELHRIEELASWVTEDKAEIRDQGWGRRVGLHQKKYSNVVQKFKNFLKALLKVLPITLLIAFYLYFCLLSYLIEQN